MEGADVRLIALIIQEKQEINGNIRGFLSVLQQSELLTDIHQQMKIVSGHSGTQTVE